jgi:hypothetical protein
MIERTAAIEGQGIRPEEEQAIMIVWRKQGHRDDEAIPEADVLQILAEIRKRETMIEQSALAGLIRATSEGRRVPRRHMRFALLVVFPIAILIIAIVAWIGR